MNDRRIAARWPRWLIALVVVLVLAAAGFGVWRWKMAPVPVDVGGPSVPPTDDPFATVQAVTFTPESAKLPVDADGPIGRVSDAARSREGASVLISAFADSAATPASAADLAQRRALAVRHALEANGVPPRFLLMSRPLPASGVDAGRVEMRLQ